MKITTRKWFTLWSPWSILAILALLASSIIQVQAQKAPDSLLIVRSNNTLYTWREADGQLRRLSLASDKVGEIALSPDGTQLAYQVPPPEIRTQLSGISSEVSATTPVDLHLYDLVSNRDTTIFKQTITADRLKLGGPYDGLSVPQWSPDSKQIAWNSSLMLDPANTAPDSLKIYTYDLENHKTSSFTANIANCCNPLFFVWFPAGFSVAANESEIVTLGPDGRLLNHVDIKTPIASLFAVKQNGQDYIGARDFKNVLTLVDPLTGESKLSEGGIERYSLPAAENSLAFFAAQRPDFVDKWWLSRPGSPPQALNFGPLTISPAGDRLAYLGDDTVAYVWKDGQSIPVKGTGVKGVTVTDLVWSAPAWRVQPASVNGFVVASAETVAKFSDAPLLIRTKSDLYAWTKGDKTLRPITHSGDVSPATMSPDGKYALYLARVGIFGGTALSSYRDVWLLNMTSGEAKMIDSVPASGQDVLRRPPSWSPDGTQFAWVELTWPGKDHRVVVYDMASRTTKTLVSGLPYPTDIFKTWMAWGKSGVAVGWVSPSGNEVRVYSPEGALVSKAVLKKSAYPFAPGVIWIDDQGKDSVAVVMDDENGKVVLTLIDPQTGKMQQAPGELELFNPAAPDKGIGVFYANLPSDSINNWRVRLPSGEIDPINAEGGIESSLAVSPDGMEVAYSMRGQAFIYRDGEVFDLPLGDKQELGAAPYVAWGPVAYRLRKTS